MSHRLKVSPKLTYPVLLTLLGMGTFGAFSTSSLHLGLKLYGLSLFLQAGFALLYFAVWRRRDRDYRQSTDRYS
jgi:hypothetical protein